VTELLESEVVVTARAFFPVELRSQRSRIRTTFLRSFVVERCLEDGVELNQSSMQELSGEIGVEPIGSAGDAVDDETQEAVGLRGRSATGKALTGAFSSTWPFRRWTSR